MNQFMAKAAEQTLEKTFSKLLTNIKQSGYDILSEQFSSLSPAKCEQIVEQAWRNALSSVTTTHSIHKPITKPSMTKEEFFALDEEPWEDSFTTSSTYTRNSFERADQSKLYKYGYSVAKDSELSSKQRQDLLKHLIQTKKLSKGYITSLLEHLIETNGKKESNSNAVAKWTADLNFVRNI